ncbi:MAG: flagellar basal body-associated FliL family protein [Pirellulales bacterium]|nr:flagellar basal body-associated FliL family protein [Planctomycetales bacterium]
MAKSENDSVPEATPVDEVPTTGSSRIARLRILGVIAVVVIVECTAAYLYLPSADVSAADDPAELEQRVEDLMDDEVAQLPDLSEDNKKEVELDSFQIVYHDVTQTSTYSISFTLFATIDKEDAEEFSQRFKERQNRFKDQVMTIIRSSTPEELTDSELGLIKHKILNTTNRLLGGEKPLINGIIFTEYRFAES